MLRFSSLPEEPGEWGPVYYSRLVPKFEVGGKRATVAFLQGDRRTMFSATGTRAHKATVALRKPQNKSSCCRRSSI